MATEPQTNTAQPVSLLKRLAAPEARVPLLILLVAALSLNLAATQLQVHFQKRPIDLKTFGRELTEFPMQVGDWVMVSRDTRLNADIEHALGTEQYIFRDYVNSQYVTDEQVRQMREMPEGRRIYELDRLQREHPGSVVRFALTYYTGMVDTVAHIPERCYVADGYEAKETVAVTWGEGDDATDARFISFQDATTLGKLPRCVGYFFYVNNKQKGDPLGVRTELQNLFQRYSYYAKVEMMVAHADPETAKRTMGDFYAAARPEVLKCLPDWQKVEEAEKNER